MHPALESMIEVKRKESIISKFQEHYPSFVEVRARVFFELMSDEGPR
jgi:hypothetical protein